MRFPQWMGYGLACGALLLIGCTANMVSTTKPSQTAGPINLFGNSHGYGSIVMRVVDERKGYGVQALADADSFDEVHIRLGGSKIPTRFASMSANPTQIYLSDKLGMLPPASDYNLVVSLASHSVLLRGPVLVGQGASESIDLVPGATKSVTIYINAVGDVKLLSNDYYVFNNSPEVSTDNRIFGFPEILARSVVTAKATFSSDPAIPPSQRIHYFRMQLNDPAGAVMPDADGVALSSASATSSIDASGTGYRPFKVPAISANEALGYLTIYGINYDASNSVERVISTKTRGILMLKGATLSVDLNPPTL